MLAWASEGKAFLPPGPLPTLGWLSLFLWQVILSKGRSISILPITGTGPPSPPYAPLVPCRGPARTQAGQLGLRTAASPAELLRLKVGWAWHWGPRLPCLLPAPAPSAEGSLDACRADLGLLGSGAVGAKAEPLGVQERVPSWDLCGGSPLERMGAALTPASALLHCDLPLLGFDNCRALVRDSNQRPGARREGGAQT